MKKLTFRMKSYLRAGEQFHFARKYLLATPPRVVHTHDYYECFWIEQGDCVHWVNGKKVDLPVACIVFMRPTDTHGVQARGSRPCRLVNVSFPASSAEHLLERYRETLEDRFFWATDALPQAWPLDHLRMSRLTRQAMELERGPRGLAEIEGFLLGLTTRILGRPRDIADHAPHWLATACEAAQDPEVFRQGAAGLVAATGRSHEHACRAMRQFVGQSPSTYVNRLRMEHAARLLAGSDETITGIALDCGLENVSHFYRLFRNQFGMTPRAYRQHHQVDIVQPQRD